MVDDVFRSYRNHNTVAWEGSETSRGGIGDLLAELARLTGQGDAYRNGRRDDRSSQAKEDDTSSEQRQRAEDHYIALWRRNHPLSAESTASRRSRHPTDIFRDPRSNSMASLGTPATIRQRLTSFSTQTQGSRLHPAEKIGSQFCRAPEHRRSSPLCPMTATMARCGRPRLTKLTGPIAFTMVSRARAGGSSW